jgi:urease accessory protein
MERNSLRFTTQFGKEVFMRLIPNCRALTGALIIAVVTANAVGQSHSFAMGVAHPLLGVDHILVMIAVGLWAVFVGGRAVWALPLTFLTTMLGGFAAASVGLDIPLVEPVISSSMIALGLLVALAVRAPLWLSVLITAMFAFFHGHAHGTEAAAASLISYALGFTFSTATLHGIGIGFGILAASSTRQVALRAMGGVVALIGIALIVI